MAKATFKIEGMNKLLRDIKKLGTVPQKHVTASARKGMNTVLKDARADAPYDTGDLEKGMKLYGERSKFKGKKAYQVIFDRKYNDVFQKRNKEGKVTGYYPISQEYGFFAVNGRYIPGFRFIHNSLANNAEKAGQIMVDTMRIKIESEARKVGLK